MRNRHTRLAALILAGALAGCQPSGVGTQVGPVGYSFRPASAQECAPTIQRYIDAFGLTDDVESITYSRDDVEIESRGFEYTRRVLAWVNLRSCVGYVVFDTRQSCRVARIYTRGDCPMPRASGPAPAS